MHCLEVIKARNDHAAGREMAHALNDGSSKLATAIYNASATPGGWPTKQFIDAAFTAREEG